MPQNPLSILIKILYESYHSFFANFAAALCINVHFFRFEKMKIFLKYKYLVPICTAKVKSRHPPSPMATINPNECTEKCPTNIRLFKSKP
jgi:hypothetical protein